MLDSRILGEPCGEPSEARDALGSMIGAQGAAVGRSDQRWVAPSLPRAMPATQRLAIQSARASISWDVAEGDPEATGVRRAGRQSPPGQAGRLQERCGSYADRRRLAAGGSTPLWRSSRSTVLASAAAASASSA